MIKENCVIKHNTCTLFYRFSDHMSFSAKVTLYVNFSIMFSHLDDYLNTFKTIYNFSMSPRHYSKCYYCFYYLNMSPSDFMKTFYQKVFANITFEMRSWISYSNEGESNLLESPYKDSTLFKRLKVKN